MRGGKPLVSIIMPAYNAGKYIAEAIESVMNQTFEAWELLIIDDGSADGTAQIIRSIYDERIVLIQQENGGVSSARNRGLDLAKGKYITFLDADDVLPSQSLESRVTYLESHSEVDLVDGKISVRDADIGKEIRMYEPQYNGLLLPRLIALDSQVFFGIIYMFKKEMLGEIRFKKDMTHAEDLLFYIEMASKQKIYYASINDEIYQYRTGHTSSMTNLDGLEDGYIKLIKEVRKFKNVSIIGFIVFKTKIVKIMFLSWLRNDGLLRALKSMIRILQVNLGK